MNYKVRTNEELLNEQLTPHFKRSEFACNCKGKYCSPRHMNIDLRVVDICEVIRQYVDKPIRISSGCRCAIWNKQQGGVESSSHCYGFASDLHCAIGGKALFVAIQDLYKQGLISNLRYCQYYIKSDFCHIDIDINKKRSNVFATVNK